MSVAFKIRVWEKATVTGTGAITLPGVPASGGYQTFASAFPSGATVTYVISDATAGAWEAGTGVFTASGSTLSRTPSESSNAGALVNFPGNTGCDVSVDILSPVTSNSGAASEGRVPALGVAGTLDASFSAAAVLRAVLDGAIGSMYNNARTKNTMWVPPTLTVASTLPSTFTRTKVFGATGAPFISGGGNPVTSGGATSFPCVTQSSTSGELGMHWRVETILDGSAITFKLDGATADGYRFLVDGQYVSMAGTATAIATPVYYTLTFNSRTKRRITVEGHDALRFWSASTVDLDELIAPEQTYRPQIFVIGDSNVEAYGVNLKGDGPAAVISDCIGALDVRASAVFGTGFLETNGSNNWYNYSQRRSDWVNANPDLLVYFLSINDADYSPGFTAAQVASAVTTEIAYVRSIKGPAFPIIIYGVVTDIEGLQAQSPSTLTLLQDQETATVSAVNALNDPFVAMIPTLNSGFGSVVTGASATQGNNPLYGNASTGHATPGGYVAVGLDNAIRIVQACAQMMEARIPRFAEPVPAGISAQFTEDFITTSLPTTPLVWGYHGGVISINGTPTVVPSGTLTLGASTTTYVSLSKTGSIVTSTSGWTSNAFPLRVLVTSVTEIISSLDARGYLYSA